MAEFRPHDSSLGTWGEGVAQRLPRLPAGDPEWTPDAVDCLISCALESRASDVHLVPAAEGLEMSWRVDGVLHRIGRFAPAVAPRIVARLKVLAELLTYRTDVPQEGTIRGAASGHEVRVATFPTLHGEKAVVRLFAAAAQPWRLDELGFDHPGTARLRELLRETGGVILFCGPAGSGKTTTACACLRELAGESNTPRSLTSLEDPVETEIPGVAQSQVHLPSGFDLSLALRSLVRQDPEVIFIGEIRDRQIAAQVLEVGLTGHLVLTTFHAGSAAESISRLGEMGLEPYQLRSGLLAVVAQRLVRRLCSCARESDAEEHRLGLAVPRMRVPVGCPTCRGSGYGGRLLLSEMLVLTDPDLRNAIFSQTSTDAFEQAAIAAGMRTLWHSATVAVAEGKTSPAEIRRVLGYGLRRWNLLADRPFPGQDDEHGSLKPGGGEF